MSKNKMLFVNHIFLVCLAIFRITTGLLSNVPRMNTAVNSLAFKTSPTLEDTYSEPLSKYVSNHCRTKVSAGSIIVNCSNTNQSRVPNDIPRNTTELILNNNEITILHNDSFQQLENLKRLSIKSNSIHTIEVGAFRKLFRLWYLTLYHNRITLLPDHVFSPLASLYFLELGYNRIAIFNSAAFINTTRLATLVLSTNNLNEFPVFLHHNSTHITPNLKSLYLNSNVIARIPTNKPIGLKKLESLAMCCNRLHYLVAENFKLFPSLRNVSLHRNDFLGYQSRRHGISPHAFKSISLEQINLKYTYYAVNDIFRETPNLRKLELAGDWINTSAGISTFQHLSNLNVLDLSSTHVKLREGIFKGSTGIQWLDLSDNGLSDLNGSIFNPLENLTQLYLSNNQISTVNKTSLPSPFWNNLTEIDLSYNQLICDCRLIWFRTWLMNNTDKVKDFFKKPNGYYCVSPEIIPIQSLLNRTLLNSDTINCISSTFDWYLFDVSLIASLVSCSALVVSILHRFRWHVRI